jgi:peptidoglycan/xylan/chitin deacetylase (PgdA/CDA1 family)
VSPGRVAIWVASIGALALAARSILLGPLPLAVALGAFALYVALALTGVMVPRLEMFGDVTWQGDDENGGLALTFDDGPNPQTTPRVLSALASAGVTATFFVIGEKVTRYPDVARAIVDGGHSLGVHGYTHNRLYALLPPSAVVQDIEKTVAAIVDATGVKPRWFRPPVGQVSPRTAAGAKKAGFEIVAWSARGLDGVSRADPDRVLFRLDRGIEPGAILQLHDAAENDDHVPASLEILPRLLSRIEERGLRVVPLGSLLGES